jgi:hypothetical protein
VSNLTETHVAVHLGIAAACDVKDIAGLGLLLDFHFHGAADLPECLAVKVCVDVLPPTFAANSLACSIGDLRTASAIVLLATSTPWLAFNVS